MINFYLYKQKPIRLLLDWLVLTHQAVPGMVALQHCHPKCLTCLVISHIMNKLIRIKHWQLFVVLVFVPLIIQTSLFLILFKKNGLLAFFAIATKVMLPFAIFFLAWLWSIGILLSKNISSIVNAQLNFKVFKICLFVAFVGVVFLGLFPAVKFIANPESLLAKVSLFVNPLSSICLLYCINFNAKALKTIEWQESVAFRHYKDDFILLFVFPIGIWFIQPRINVLARPSAAIQTQLPD